MFAAKYEPEHSLNVEIGIYRNADTVEFTP